MEIKILIFLMFLPSSFQIQESVNVIGVGVINGYTTVLPTNKRMTSFLGIPYADINTKRFAPVKKIWKTEDPFNATQQNYCIQETTSNRTNQDEDCLSLSIFKPSATIKNDKKYPVLVVIHGGSFIRWGAAMFTGERMIAKHDIVVVSINYRLNVFGFFTLGNDAAPGNLALLDQLFALTWIQDYIKYFSGDPERITLYGQSAGAASVGYLTYTKLADGLFMQAIQSSGDNLGGWTVNPFAEQQSRELAEKLDCDEEDDESILACLREFGARELYNAIYPNLTFYSAPTIQNWVNLSEELRIVPKHPMNNTKDDRLDVALLIGTNLHDGSVQLSRYLNSAHLTEANLTDPEFLNNHFGQDLLNSSNFNIKDDPVALPEILISGYTSKRTYTNFTEMAPAFTDGPALEKVKRRMVDPPLETYMYSFEFLNENRNHSFMEEMGGRKEVPPGVFHGDELFYLFKLSNLEKEKELNVSDNLIDIFASFIKETIPKDWEPVTEDKFPYMVISEEVTYQQDYRENFKTDPKY